MNIQITRLARPGKWGGRGASGFSDWLRVKFKAGLFQTVRGLVRFHLVRLAPEFELYASPVNFDPEVPLFPISAPGDYAFELAEQFGPFHTTGTRMTGPGAVPGGNERTISSGIGSSTFAWRIDLPVRLT